MSVPNDQVGHGQMSCNPEAHDYAGFGPKPLLRRVPVHDPRPSDPAGALEELMALSKDELCRRYYESVRNCTLAEQQRIECGVPSITAADSPKLVTARNLYEAWQIKALPFRSRRVTR